MFKREALIARILVANGRLASLAREQLSEWDNSDAELDRLEAKIEALRLEVIEAAGALVVI